MSVWLHRLCLCHETLRGIFERAVEHEYESSNQNPVISCIHSIVASTVHDPIMSCQNNVCFFLLQQNELAYAKQHHILQSGLSKVIQCFLTLHTSK